MGTLRAGLLAALLALCAGAATADDPARKAYEKSQAAIGNGVGDHRLTDMNGAALRLGALTDRPLVISLVYTSCGTVCPVVSDHLREVVLDARRALGADSFNVLTFGFDARGDSPEKLRGFAVSHRIENMPRWWVASADPATTQVLLRELGFSYEDIAGGFRHVTQTTVLAPGGEVFRQVYGDDFPPPMLVEPLKELVLGGAALSPQPADLWKRIAFLCTTYDPATGAYRFDYAIFFGVFFGALSLLLTALVILRLWRERRRAMQAGGT
ncbi:protein SCO1/2 [Meinhardsimonia xiamenensis]|jgi:protein SCO1/2|uniref:Protein SCO1/2 n=1 Tax=Meinhardsimonia xiamenensis TaxID=990712 RepID=A0A1G9DBT6_9RHOB|nr:SCO family protein [Meinhardsimonia xiamenensis]PRX38053.1 protein SCO1/2 [Meinhardsimonia xiamenensis]SDK61329.1 protein SCO1/2 [Meinhardsimonia xiamenensis]